MQVGEIVNCCGNKNSLVKDISIRKWICPKCNNIHDRDINAAENIFERGLEKLFV